MCGSVFCVCVFVHVPVCVHVCVYMCDCTHVFVCVLMSVWCVCVCVCARACYADTSKLPNAYMWWEEMFLLLFLSVIVGVAREGIFFSVSQQHIISGYYLASSLQTSAIFLIWN